MNPFDFERMLWHSSVQLVRVDGLVPDLFASGALVDYGGNRLLLTVSHATGKPGRWAIQLKYVPGTGTQLFSLGPMNFLAKGSLFAVDAKLEDIDFSYAKVPGDLLAFRQQIEPCAKTVECQTAITVHKPSFLDIPEKGVNYGFCGTVRCAPDESLGETYVRREIRVYPGLSFVRTEQEYHYFSLPVPFPGHEHFRGCSGAPILSEDGAIVALLCGGDADEKLVFGVSLRTYKVAIDILVGDIGTTGTP